MARHEEYLKYGMYAVGAYLAYKYVWPALTSEIKTITSNITTSVSTYVPGSNIPASSIASVMNPSGISSSSIFGVNLPANTSVQAGYATSPNINQGMAIYYITAQDSANISLMAPVNTTNLSFNDWSKYYRQAKGISLPLTANSVGVDSTQLITLSQFTVLVNTHYPKPTLTGIFGSMVDNRWYGVA